VDDPADVGLLLPTFQKCLTGASQKRPGGPALCVLQGHGTQLLFHNADDGYSLPTSPSATTCDARRLGSRDQRLMLSRVRVPVLLFYGLNDRVLAAGTGERQALSSPAATTSPCSSSPTPAT